MAVRLVVGVGLWARERGGSHQPAVRASGGKVCSMRAILDFWRCGMGWTRSLQPVAAGRSQEEVERALGR